MQSVCGIRCAIKAPVKARKAAKAEDKARREAIKPRSKWVAEVQEVFNHWVRMRDAKAKLGCVSCGYLWSGRLPSEPWTPPRKANAGHYLSTAARPELRFHEHNVWLQCEQCNTYLSGNLIPYRAELIRRIGLPAVEALEGPHPAAKLTIDDLKRIKAEYKAKLAELRAAE
jgi:hypothetical protein